MTRSRNDRVRHPGCFPRLHRRSLRHVGRESEAARYHADGLLVVEDGQIADFGAGLVVTTIGDRLILPGFIDGHVHFPQTRVLGAFGEHLAVAGEVGVSGGDQVQGPRLRT